MQFKKEHNLKIPKKIWILWLQGWSAAPNIAKISKKSWERNNADFDVIALDLNNLADFIPEEAYKRIISKTKENEALSDEIRLELLTQQGGVWVDATTICAQPLSQWMNEHIHYGFFAFNKPAPDRMIATWFIAAKPNNYLVRQWRDSAIKYWAKRKVRDNYFWVHNLFAEVYESDPEFKLIWDAVPKISAIHDFHFVPEDQRLKNPPNIEYLEGMLNPPAPVFKLTHKLLENIPINSLQNLIYLSVYNNFIFRITVKLIKMKMKIFN